MQKIMKNGSKWLKIMKKYENYDEPFKIIKNYENYESGNPELVKTDQK